MIGLLWVAAVEAHDLEIRVEVPGASVVKVLRDVIPGMVYTFDFEGERREVYRMEVTATPAQEMSWRVQFDLSRSVGRRPPEPLIRPIMEAPPGTPARVFIGSEKTDGEVIQQRGYEIEWIIHP